MKDLETIQLDTPNADLAFDRVCTQLEDKRFDIAEIRLIDTFMRYNIKDGTRTYYYMFEVRY